MFSARNVTLPGKLLEVLSVVGQQNHHPFRGKSQLFLVARADLSCLKGCGRRVPSRF